MDSRIIVLARTESSDAKSFWASRSPALVSALSTSSAFLATALALASSLFSLTPCLRQRGRRQNARRKARSSAVG